MDKPKERHLIPSEGEALVAHNLKVMRKAARLSQDDVAERMRRLGFKFHQTQIAKIENGTRAIQFDEVIGLAKALNLPAEYFMTQAVANPDDPHYELQEAGFRLQDLREGVENRPGPRRRREGAPRRSRARIRRDRRTPRRRHHAHRGRADVLPGPQLARGPAPQGRGYFRRRVAAPGRPPALRTPRARRPWTPFTPPIPHSNHGRRVALAPPRGIPMPEILHARYPVGGRARRHPAATPATSSAPTPPPRPTPRWSRSPSRRPLAASASAAPRCTRCSPPARSRP